MTISSLSVTLLTSRKALLVTVFVNKNQTYIFSKFFEGFIDHIFLIHQLSIFKDSFTTLLQYALTQYLERLLRLFAYLSFLFLLFEDDIHTDSF